MQQLGLMVLGFVLIHKEVCKKIPQIGNVIIGNSVEIGANSV
jgi:UDP-3-O-[3-hydroxymyristoyl] glucosamine N-acyltransferase